MIRKFFSIYHWSLAFLGNIFFLFPSSKLFVVGVTGTKGKSTTIELMNAIAEDDGKKTALLSSVRKKIGKNSKKNTGNTMPGRFAIQKFLHKAVKSKCSYVFIEVSSQGIVQHRHRFIDWNVSVFLNLSPEHIESHGSFEKYRNAKLSFFDYTSKLNGINRYFLINKEDENHKYFENVVKKNKKAVTFFGKMNFMRNIGEKKKKTPREFLGEWVSAEFNIENAAAAFEFAKILDIDIEKIGNVFRNFKGVPGRLDIVIRKPFFVIVDYAHTPNSLEALYKTVERLYLSDFGRIICVLGSASGGRDVWKRPKMGSIAGKYCSEIILTNEDPYNEDPQKITNEIRSGIPVDFPHANIYEIIDREEAIAKAIFLAKEGDAVVLTGKGSESSIHIEKGRKIPWNEKEVVKKVLDKKIGPKI